MSEDTKAVHHILYENQCYIDKLFFAIMEHAHRSIEQQPEDCFLAHY